MQNLEKTNQNQMYDSFSIIIEWGRILQSDYVWRARSMLQRLSEQILQIFKEKTNNEIIILYNPESVKHSKLEKFIMQYLAPCKNIIKITIQPTGLSYYDLKNLGVDISSTELVMFIDSDIVPDEDWLIEMLKSFQQTGVDVVSGNTYIGLHNLTAKIFALIMFQPPSNADGLYEMNHFYGQNVGFRRKIFLSHPFPKLNAYHGHADTLITELVNDDIKIYKQPKCRADHPMPITLRDFVTWALIQGLVWPIKRKAIRKRNKNIINTNNPSTFRQIILRTINRFHYVPLSPKVVIGACGILPAYFFIHLIGIVITILWPNYFDYMERNNWKMWL